MMKGGKKIIGNRLPTWLIDDDGVLVTSIVVFLFRLYVINETHFICHVRWQGYISRLLLSGHILRHHATYVTLPSINMAKGYHRITA